MPRIQAIHPEQAQGKTKELLEGVRESLGMVPNIIRTIAQSSNALDYYLAAGKALKSGQVNARFREQIALTVAGENTCDYCAAAHTALGKMTGLDELELARNLNGDSRNLQIDEALKFAKTVVAKRGFVSNADLQKMRDTGYDDGEIVEIVAHVTHNIFTNYINHIAETDVDFPSVDTGLRAAA